MINFAANLNKMITAGLGGETEAPHTEVAVGHRIQYLDASGPVASFETNIVAPLRKLLVNMLPIQAGSGDPSPENIRPISGRDAVNIYVESEYDETADPAVTIPLGQTVYGGSLDVTNGKMTVEYVKWSPDPTATPTVSDIGDGWVRVAYASVANRPPYAGHATTTGFYSHGEYATGWAVKTNHSYVSETNVAYFWFTCEATVSAVRAYIAEQVSAGTPVELVYKIKEPFAVDMDPQQITSLIGNNSIWSDAGDVDVTYIYYEETEGY